MSARPGEGAAGRTRRPTLAVRIDGSTTVVEIRPRASAARSVIAGLALAWAALAVAWVAAVSASRAPAVFSLAVIPFLAIGIVVNGRMLAAFPAASRLVIDAQGLRLLPRGVLAGRPTETALDLVGECRVGVAAGPGGLLRPEVSVEVGVRTIRVGAGLGQADLRSLLETLRAAIERARCARAAGEEAGSLTPGTEPVDSGTVGGVPESRKE